MQSLENDIKDTEDRLKRIREEKRNLSEESEDYQSLEDQRRVLRKHLIDLDYEHKVVFEQYKKKNQEIERQKSEEKIKQLEEECQQIQQEREKEQLERSRKLQEQLDEIHKDQDRRR